MGTRKGSMDRSTWGRIKNIESMTVNVVN